MDIASVRVRAPPQLLKRPSNLFRGFFGFINIYHYIRIMKNPFEGLTEEQIKRLMFTTDLSLYERNKELFEKNVRIKQTENKKPNP